MNFSKYLSICFQHLGVVFRDAAHPMDKRTYRCNILFFNEIRDFKSVFMHRCAMTFTRIHADIFELGTLFKMCQPAGNCHHKTGASKTISVTCQRLKLMTEVQKCCVCSLSGVMWTLYRLKTPLEINLIKVG